MSNLYIWLLLFDKEIINQNLNTIIFYWYTQFNLKTRLIVNKINNIGPFYLSILTIGNNLEYFKSTWLNYSSKPL